MTRYIDIEYYLLSTIYYLLSKLVDNKGINLNGEGKEPIDVFRCKKIDL